MNHTDCCICRPLYWKIVWRGKALIHRSQLLSISQYFADRQASARLLRWNSSFHRRFLIRGKAFLPPSRGLSFLWRQLSSDCTVFSSSSRSSAEREAERAQRRQLLETSLIKLRQPNLPLRKHLLVYETIKQIQVSIASIPVFLVEQFIIFRFSFFSTTDNRNIFSLCFVTFLPIFIEFCQVKRKKNDAISK